jgi:predicted ATP-binding protein involved in virulence
MADLAFALLKENVDKILEYSGDNKTFSPAQRDRWLIKGFELGEKLKQLANATIAKTAAPDIAKANQQLTIINDRLRDKAESLSKFPDTIQKIDDATSILDTIIGFIL